VSAAFQYARFDPAGTVGHVVGGDPLQGRIGYRPHFATRASKRSIHRHSASMAGFSGGIRLSSAFLGNAATLLFY